MNNSNICPIIFSNKNNITNNLNNSIKYYEEQTKEHITKHLPIYLKNNRKKLKDTKLKKIIHYILSNEDMFSNIMTAIMLADHTYDKKGGSLKHWRAQNCLWTLNKTFYKNKIRMTNISEDILSRSNKFANATDLLTNETPLDNTLSKERYTELERKIDSLEKRDREMMKLYYQDNKSEKEIGKIFSLSQQRVSKILIKARQQIK